MKMMSPAMMSNENPWAGISPSGTDGLVSAKRVSAEGKWNFFWGRDQDGRNLLLLSHSESSSPNSKLPELRGVEVVKSNVGGRSPMLVIRLLDVMQWEVFLTLCGDIITAAESESEERVAVAVAVARTWRWHYLLRGGHNTRLSPDEQKGLIGELATLKDMLFLKLDPHLAVDAWKGPFGATKDFLLGKTALECKAQRGQRNGFVAISSEFQLDSAGLEAVFLRIIDIVSASKTDDGAVDIMSYAEGILNFIRQKAPGAVGAFEERLEAAGLRAEDNYSDDLWLIGRALLCRIAGDFPRLVPTAVPNGIASVSYSIAVPVCEQFAVPESEFWKVSFGKPIHGN